jgi:hypothetical protein
MQRSAKLLALALFAIPAHAGTVLVRDFLSLHCPMPSNLASAGSVTFQCPQGSWAGGGLAAGGQVLEVDGGLQFFQGYFDLYPPNGQGVIAGPIPPNQQIATFNFSLTLGGSFSTQTWSNVYFWDDTLDTILADHLQILPVNAFRRVGLFNIPVPGATPAEQYDALAGFLSGPTSGTITMNYVLNDPDLQGYSLSGAAAGFPDLTFSALFAYHYNSVPEPPTYGLFVLGIAFFAHRLRVHRPN